MKSYRKELWFEVPTRRDFINITSEIQSCIEESGIQEGLVLVNAMHITASVFINDDESGLHHDCDVWLEKLAPHEPVKQYRILKRQTQKEEEMDRFKRRNYSYQRFAQTCDLQLKDGLAKEISRSL